MKIVHIISLVLCLSSIQGYPTRPLDDIDRNLNWTEAWDGDEMTRKKVVPKSVFIAPDFSNPQKCGNGYELNSNGNCVKLHSLDADSQLNFLFNKILAGLPPSDVDTPDPVRLNVPFDHTESHDKMNLALVFTKDQNEDDVAVVVAPTNGSFNPDLPLQKDDEQPEIGGVTTTTEGDITATTPAIITTITTEDISTQPSITSFTVDPLTETTTTEYPATTTFTTDIFTITETTSSRAPVTDTRFTTTSNFGGEETTESEASTVDAGDIVQAIFFRMPTTEINDDESTTKRELFSTNYVSPSIFTDDTLRQSSNFVSFVDDEDARKRPQRHNVKFPNSSPELFYFNRRNRDKNLWRFNNLDGLSATTTEEKSSQLFKQLEQLSHILNKRKSR